MTAQIAEQIKIDGETLAMCTEPLADFFRLSGKKVAFAANCTALWRGYVGEWEIVADRLYLVGLSGTLRDGVDATLADIFPDFPCRVFAHWFSGRVRIPKGRLLNYVHGGYGSTYEQDLFIIFRHGVVVGSSTQINGYAIDSDTPEGYGIRGMTVFPTERNDKELEA